jgi:hypothetical protein
MASPVHLVSLRLVKAYRGYKSGEVIQATSKLAAELERLGVATREAARPLLDASRFERAVATPIALEAR